jgi:hypothetical protein
VCVSNRPLETGAVSRLLPVSALKTVVLPLLGKPIMPSFIEEFAFWKFANQRDCSKL